MLVVGLLGGGAGEAVLRLTGAGAEAVQPPAVFGVVDVVLEEQLRGKTEDLIIPAAFRPKLYLVLLHL